MNYPSNSIQKTLGLLLMIAGTALLLTGCMSFDDVINPPPQDRFVDNGDGTVTDTATNLIWLQRADCFGGQDWDSANRLAVLLADGQCGLTDNSSAGDWRLPTLAGPSPPDSCLFADCTGEFASIFAPTCPIPRIPDAAGTGCWTEGDPFSGVQTSSYWSRTAFDADEAWCAVLDRHFSSVRAKTETWNVWPVRNGP